jgi:hypothetical protein
MSVLAWSWASSISKPHKFLTHLDDFFSDSPPIINVLTIACAVWDKEEIHNRKLPSYHRLKTKDGNVFFNFPLHTFSKPSLCLMVCWPRIILYQYSETNVMHFLFGLLRVKGLYMFRALLAHPQEALHKRHLVYCVRVMSVGCTILVLETCRDP